MENGRQSGLVFGTVFKTVRRLLKSLVCSIRTAFRHPYLVQLFTGRARSLSGPQKALQKPSSEPFFKWIFNGAI
jgi:hypothetical protein